MEIRKASLEISHEITKREAETFRLKQSDPVVSEINSILNVNKSNWSLIEKINKDLQDNKVQEEILN